MSEILEAIDEDAEGGEFDSPFICEFGRVHEVDPETLSVKALIPALNPNRVHDKWVVQMTPWVGAPGYGPAFAPAVGSEVVVFGRYGDTHTLYYLSRHNERHRVAEVFRDGARGLKTETALKLLADQLIEIIGAQSVLMQAAQQMDVKGQAVRLFAGGAEMFRVEGDNAGFRGAAIARRTLPPAATDPASCVTLANAIRQLLIDLKLAQ